MAKEKLTAVRLEVSDHKKLERIAKKMDRSVAWCIRQAILNYIAQKPHEQQPGPPVAQ